MSLLTRKKKVAAAVAMGTAVLSMVALSGCSSSGGSGSNQTQTISFYSWDNPQTFKPVIALFEKENPKIKVQISYGTPVQGYISTLQTRLNSNTASDVYIITAENKVDIMKGGFAKDLSKQPFVSNLAAAAKSTYTRNGKLYGVAVSSWGGGIIYNKDLLAKVGQTSAPKTWNDFIALCTKLKAAGITPFYEGADSIPVSVAALVGIKNAALGGNLDKDIWDGKTTFEKTWTPALTQFNELFTKGLEPRSVAGLNGNQVNTEFEKGNLAMETTGSWALGGIQSAAPSLKVGFWAIPGSNSTYWAGAVSPGYAINAKTKHYDAALKFVTFLQSKPFAALYNKETGSIMTTKDFTPKLDPSLSEMAPDIRDSRFYLPQVTWPDNSAALQAEATSLIQELIQGQIKPADVGAGLDAKLKSLQG